MFEWSESISVKIPTIDEQHKKLFKIAKDIHELVQNYNGQDSFYVIVRTIKELKNYTEYHFEEEEKMMKKYDYPDIGQHITQHKEFIEYLNQIDLKEVDDNPEESIHNLLKFIAGWIFKHINNTDFKYTDYILMKMNK